MRRGATCACEPPPVRRCENRHGSSKNAFGFAGFLGKNKNKNNSAHYKIREHVRIHTNDVISFTIVHRGRIRRQLYITL